MIAIVLSAAVTAFCALFLMKSYTDQMTRDMSFALRHLSAAEQPRNECTLGTAAVMRRPVFRIEPGAPVAKAI